MGQLKLNNKYINTLTPEGLTCAYMLINLIGNHDYLYITPQLLGAIYISKKPSPSILKRIESGLKDLEKNEAIKKVEKISNIYKYDIRNLKFKFGDGEYYIHCEESDIYKILKNTKQCNRIDLFSFFIKTLTTFCTTKYMEKYQFKIGFMPYTYLAFKNNVSVKTVYRYMDLLKELKVLYVIKYKKTFRSEKGQFENSSINNTYSRYEDRQICCDYSNEVNGMYTVDDSDINESRSIVQKYHQMQKGREYELEEVKKIYEGIKDWNKRHEEIYESQTKKGLNPPIPEYKDLSIFEKYGLGGENDV